MYLALSGSDRQSWVLDTLNSNCAGWEEFAGVADLNFWKLHTNQGIVRASLFWSNVDLDSKNTLILMMPPFDDFDGGGFCSKKEFFGLWWVFLLSEYKDSCLSWSENFLTVMSQNSSLFFSFSGLAWFSSLTENDWSSFCSTWSVLEHIAKRDAGESEVLRLSSYCCWISMNFHIVSLVNNKGSTSSRNLLFKWCSNFHS